MGGAHHFLPSNLVTEQPQLIARACYQQCMEVQQQLLADSQRRAAVLTGLFTIWHLAKKLPNVLQQLASVQHIHLNSSVCFSAG